MPLSVLVTSGLLLTNTNSVSNAIRRTCGMIALIVPVLPVLATLPIAMGAAKDPDASDNWAV